MMSVFLFLKVYKPLLYFVIWCSKLFQTWPMGQWDPLKLTPASLWHVSLIFCKVHLNFSHCRCPRPIVCIPLSTLKLVTSLRRLVLLLNNSIRDQSPDARCAHCCHGAPASWCFPCNKVGNTWIYIHTLSSIRLYKHTYIHVSVYTKAYIHVHIYLHVTHTHILEILIS